MTNMEKIPPTKRIEYIDALRGFTMMLVVVQHIGSLCIQLDGNTPSFHNYLQQIRMPMFFLISGFVLYKAGVVWSLQHIGDFLKKKFVVQIVSTIIFFVLYAHVKKLDILNGITDGAKYGYWFTYTLFVFFMFYSIIRYICKKMEDYVIIVISAIFYVLSCPSLYEAIPFEDSVKNTIGINNWYYFSFFLIGTLMKKYFDFIQRVFDKRITLLVCILVYFLLNIYHEYISINGLIGILNRFAKSFSGILIVFIFFRNKQFFFTKEKKIGRCLQYMGRRTLDIYLLHYFLLPFQLQYVTSIFKEFPMPILEFVFSLFVALIVIAFCLLISNVIRLSPTLAHWLFGVKYK